MSPVLARSAWRLLGGSASGKKIILGDKNIENANTIAKIMNEAGYDVVPFEMDLSSRESILAIIAEAQKYGEMR